MSCLGPGYNPNPQRAWSRVQNVCTYNLDPPTAVYVPLTGQTINLADYQHAARMFVDDSFRLAPKQKFLYHVSFNINDKAAISLPNFNSTVTE